MKLGKIYWLALLLTIVHGCKVPYQPPLSNAPAGYLVVEGVINNASGSTDSTFIKLSRTQKLTASDIVIPELHAQVSVEDGQGFAATLKETTNGHYVAGPLGLDSKKPYRLRIKAANGEIYLSDLVTPTYSPPIDSIGYTVNGDQVTVYANTHNPANNTRYYRWDYTETWEMVPNDSSQYMTNGIAIVHRNAAHKYPLKCWNSDVSASIVLASTVKLTNDVVYQAPIAYVTGTLSEKLTFRYSILLRQYGLTRDEYTFWSQEQKNSEQLGSIFDAQPSQINGNIHSTTNPAEPVFGYIGVTNVQIKRAYITRSNLPSSFITGFDCSLDSIFQYNRQYINPGIPLSQSERYPPTVFTSLVPLGSTLVPVIQTLTTQTLDIQIPPFQYADTGYMSAPEGCLNCALNGSPIKPAFWTGP